MIVSVNSQLLAQELRALNKVIPTKSGLPILTYAWVNAEGSQLNFYGTDLEVGFSTQCSAHVLVPGTITLPAKRLLDMVEQMPDAEVQLTLDKGAVRLNCGAFKSRIQTMPAHDFPLAPDVAGNVSSFGDGVLQAMIGRVLYAISDKTSKYVINAALLSQVAEFAVLVATDGKRLSVTTLSIPGGDTVAETVIPSKTLEALVQVFPDGPIDASRSEKHLFFTSGEQTLVSRMIDSPFPAYKKIIPEGSTKVVMADRLALASAIRRVGMASEENKATYFTFTENSLAIATSSAEVGDAFEQLTVMYEGPQLKICANWQYVLDFLNAAAGSVVKFEMKEATSPLKLVDGDDFINVIMTMRA